MKNLNAQNRNFNFGGIENQNFKKAKVIILPVPYEATTSYIKGTQQGPQAIVKASYQLDEIWGEKILPKINKEKLIYTKKELNLSGPPPKALDQLIKYLEGILNRRKIPFLLGGEHTITLAGVKVSKKKFKNLSVLQLDAHPDLRDQYQGEKFSHACVMRRVEELGVPITAVGIRSVDGDVADYINRKKIKNIFYAPRIPVQKILKTLSKNVYLTVDLDVFDSSIMPSVGTPQPGGLGWYEVLDLIEKVAKTKNIVGVDVVELCPISSLTAPDFLAAKLVYKIIEFLLKCNNKY